MKKITDIIPQKNDKKRVNLYIDGQFYSGVEKIALLQENLHIGDFVDDAKLEKIVQESEYSTAFNKASGYILKGGHTRKQVYDYLIKKGYSQQIANKVLDKLKSYGYLDDSQFAKTYVELKSHKYGKHLMSAHLKQKGVKEEDIQSALDTLENEDENAYYVGKKYIKNRPFDLELRQKCYRYLLSKGFSYDSVQCAIDKLKAESDLDEV